MSVPLIPSQYLLKRRRLRRLVMISLALVSMLSVLDQLGAFGSNVNDFARFDRSHWTVEQVVDGDTLQLVDSSLRRARIHLLGVDSPDAGAHWFSRARNYATARSLNRDIMLRLEGTQSRDNDGDLRGYVYLSDIESLNLAMVRDGQAYADRRVKHTYTAVFEQAENVVRKRGGGLWKELAFNQMPAWRQKWLLKLSAARAARDASGDSKDRAE